MARAIGRHGRENRRGHVAQFHLRLLLVEGFALLGLLAKNGLHQRFKRSGVALQRPADDRQINVVDEHAAFRQRRVVALVDLPAKRVIEGGGDRRLDLAPDDVRIDREAAIGERAHKIVAPEHSDVDVGPIRRLK